jgi:hypothetical protein
MNTTTARPTSFQGDLRNLPEALAPLKALPNWVCWKWEWKIDKKGNGKWTKPPYQPRNPIQYARNNDPSTWGTYEEALAAFEAGRCDGIGFNLLGHEFSAFDLDKCRDRHAGTIAPEAMEIVDRAKSYTEMTVSGTGLRVIGFGDKSTIHCKQKIPGSNVEVESYSNTARYIVISGNPLPGTCPHLGGIGREMKTVVAKLDAPQQVEELNFEKPAANPVTTVLKTLLPAELLNLISGPPQGCDLSREFHHAVNWLGDCGYSADRIERLIAGKPIVPDRYSDRLMKEIERCLGKAKLKQDTPYTNDAPPKLSGPIIKSSGEFIKGFVPPDYVLDGVLVRSFLYSLTGQTGSGKTCVTLRLAASVALGQMFAGRGTEKCRVLYAAAENPVDVMMRWTALAQHMGFDPDEIEVYFASGAFSLKEKAAQLQAEAQAIGGRFGLVIVDTGPVFFEGEDENNRKQMGDHARLMRNLIEVIPGRPCVVVNGHPVKNATADNLLPAGGGTFLNEVDGNLTCAKRESLSEVHWQGKFRGVEFAPMAFLIKTVTHQDLKDKKGRLMPTVICEHVGEQGQEEIKAAGLRDEDEVLRLVDGDPKITQPDIARALGWKLHNGEPNKVKAARVLQELIKLKLIKLSRRRHLLTEEGKKALKSEN